MTIDDILEIEQMKYCYEQAYVTHRQADMPVLFEKSPDTVFTIPSAEDYTRGWDKVYEKFTEDLPMVSPDEDSYHTGWQICTPFIWEDKEGVHGIFPTFGYLVLSMDPQQFRPPYHVLATMECWQDIFTHIAEGWKISRLQAQFLMGQPTWSWDTSGDMGYATGHRLREIPHPYWGKVVPSHEM